MAISVNGFRHALIMYGTYRLYKLFLGADFAFVAAEPEDAIMATFTFDLIAAVFFLWETVLVDVASFSLEAVLLITSSSSSTS